MHTKPVPKKKNQVLIEIDSQNDKLIFTIKNQVENIGLGEISHFFEKGFSTKEDGKKHGLGLYNAKMLVNRYHGEMGIEERKYISFVVVI
jgi:two-component system sensor histidine kinase AgrC